MSSISSKQGREYVVRDQGRIRQILKLLMPYVKLKSQQVKLSLRLMNRLRGRKSADDFMNAAKLADRIASLNTRSRSRRKNTSRNIHLKYPRND